MSGLGLTQALQGYQQGKAWKEQQDYKANLQAANDAFTASMDEDKAKWAMQGAEGQYTPTDEGYLKASQARMVELAKRGMYDDYMRGQAALSAPIVKMRQTALDRSGGDEAELLRQVYPTFLDNKEATSVDWVDGSGPNGATGAKKLRMVLSDGTVKFFEPGQVTAMVQKSIQTPEMRLAEAKFLYDQKRDAARYAQAADLKQQQSELDSDLEAQRQEGRMSLADFQQSGRMAQIAARGDEARDTKAVAPGRAAGGGGGSRSALSEASLDLRTVQQQRMRLDARRKEALTLLKERQAAAKSLNLSDDKREALKRADAEHAATMARLDREDAALQRRLEGRGTASVGLDQFDRGSAPSNTGKKPALSDFYTNR